MHRKRKSVQNSQSCAKYCYRRIYDLGSNIFHEIADKARNFLIYYLTLDDSNDASGTSQLLVFIRGVDNEFNNTRKSASVHSMDTIGIGEDIFKELQKTV